MRLHMQSRGEHFSYCDTGDYWLDDNGCLWMLLSKGSGGWRWVKMDLDELPRTLEAIYPVNLNPKPEHYGGW